MLVGGSYEARCMGLCMASNAYGGIRAIPTKVVHSITCLIRANGVRIRDVNGP